MTRDEAIKIYPDILEGEVSPEDFHKIIAYQKIQYKPPLTFEYFEIKARNEIERLKKEREKE